MSELPNTQGSIIPESSPLILKAMEKYSPEIIEKKLNLIFDLSRIEENSPKRISPELAASYLQGNVELFIYSTDDELLLGILDILDSKNIKHPPPDVLNEIIGIIKEEYDLTMSDINEIEFNYAMFYSKDIVQRRNEAKKFIVSVLKIAVIQIDANTKGIKELKKRIRDIEIQTLKKELKIRRSLQHLVIEYQKQELSRIPAKELAEKIIQADSEQEKPNEESVPPPLTAPVRYVKKLNINAAEVPFQRVIARIVQIILEKLEHDYHAGTQKYHIYVRKCAKLKTTKEEKDMIDNYGIANVMRAAICSKLREYGYSENDYLYKFRIHFYLGTSRGSNHMNFNRDKKD